MKQSAPRNPDLLGLIKLGPHSVPALWRHMLPEAVWRLEVPAERRASCGDCPRVTTDGYRPDYRCCTYWPRVPNFLLGFALATKRGAAALERTLAKGYLMPEGFQASPTKWAEFLVDVGEERFGKSRSVLCPFLDVGSGFCAIYAFRNSVCSTYFCHFDHGSPGERFWESVQTLVMQVEMGLGQWALEQIGFDVRAYIHRMNELAPRMKDVSDARTGGWSETARRHAWGDLYGKELDAFRACADAIEGQLDHLWEIANQISIREASRFELAAQRIVPAAHRDQIEDEFDSDDDEGKETAPPEDLWKDVQRAYRKLWQKPDKHAKLRLSPRALIAANPLADDEARKFAAKPCMLTFHLRPGARAIKWRQFISEPEALALARFHRPRRVTPQVLAELGEILQGKPESFVAEWMGRRVLITN